MTRQLHFARLVGVRVMRGVQSSGSWPRPPTIIAIRGYYPVRRTAPRDLTELKRRGQRIPLITAYDYPTARLIDAAGVPVILVGDSVGTTALGYENTIPVTLADMVH